MAERSKYRRYEIRPSVPYQRYQELMRRRHNICEGRNVTIRYHMPECDGKGEFRRVECTVTMIDKYFITLRFPRGYEQSMLWMEFEKSRLTA